MSKQLLDSGLAALEFSRNNLLMFLGDLAEDQLTHQPVAGGNHALWITGHLASADDFFLTSLGAKESRAPGNYKELFGMGSKPVADAGAYPCLADIKDHLRARRDDLIAWFKSMSEEQLMTPLDGDMRQFAPNFAGLMFSIAWHEGMHTGQLTMVRKSLGLAPKFG